MSDFSLTLVLQIKTSKIINDMAKVQQKATKLLRSHRHGVGIVCGLALTLGAVPLDGEP